MRYSSRCMSILYTATRDAGLRALESFVERVPAYAARRSFATIDNRDVSRLSPYLRRRLITEQEVVTTVLKRYSFNVAEKFVQEVVWRTYWKGWLERNPAVWSACVQYEQTLRSGQATASWGGVYRQATAGETGLSFFNEWIRELVETGYLHNHVRMWFASIWIFTLRIPWQLGAMFMYRHLLDGDPASNTLSWRWVAGLQTRGKSYLARPDNIATFSEGRWRPGVGDLAEEGFPVEVDVETNSSAITSGPRRELPPHEYGVLTTGDDLSVKQDPCVMNAARAVGILRFAQRYEEAESVAAFAKSSEEDALRRLGEKGTGIEEPAQVRTWLEAKKLSVLVIVEPPVGANRERAREVASLLTQCGTECYWYQCEWDRQLYELADKGFFPFWERVKKRIQRGDAIFHGKIPVE